MESSRRRWVLPLLLVGVLAGVLAVRAWRPETIHVESAAVPHTEEANQQQVELVIDAGAGELRASNVNWRDGMTVQDVLAASETAFVVQGHGDAAFLTELGGVKNEGPGGRNWQFEVNHKWSDRSFGVHTLTPGDHVLWKFATSE
jgi:hypothetical protein